MVVFIVGLLMCSLYLKMYATIAQTPEIKTLVASPG